jgi:cell division protein ZapD
VAQNTAMAVTASTTSTEAAMSQLPEYEQPLNERMRTFMRLEFLYQQILYNQESDTTWATRATISSLLEIMAILMRGDVRSEVLKELDQQTETLKKFQSQPEVDSGRLGTLLANLLSSRDQIDTVGTQFKQPLKDCEFLSSIKHRSSIPGGTCEFDLPEFSHWLRQPYDRRQQDLGKWLNAIRPLCDAVIEMLWLIRESAQPSDRKAINGMYQHRMQKDTSVRLLRVTLPHGSQLYPEISGSQHRFTIRFLEWSTIDARAVQTGHDVNFQLSIC